MLKNEIKNEILIVTVTKNMQFSNSFSPHLSNITLAISCCSEITSWYAIMLCIIC